LTSRIVDGVQPILERWTGQRLNPVRRWLLSLVGKHLMRVLFFVCAWTKRGIV
jgi:hypothetical protein